MKPLALIVDDEADIRELVSMTLAGMDIDCITAETIDEAQKAIRNQAFDLCLTDMRLPDGNGLELVTWIQQIRPELPIAMISAHGNIDVAVQALKNGAFDFVSKPLKLSALRDLVSAALKLSPIKPYQRERRSRGRLLGDTTVMRELRGKITKLARSQAPVYITGESGTGKELVARLIHDLGARKDKSFIAVNCGAIPAELAVSEFFGHKKGAFTGATADKQGLFQAAHGGTIFFDEIADLSLMMQVKLLRTIQEKSVRPVGSAEETSVNVRILSATHQDLAQRVRQGDFREDLFYRLNVIELSVPALRERQADIPLLADHILQQLIIKNQQPQVKLTQQAQQALMAYAFPGNIRELENTLERAVTWAEKALIDRDDLMLPTAPDSAVSLAVEDNDNLQLQLQAQERAMIEQALNETRWNKTAAAQKLGISFRALRYKLKKLDID